MKLEDFEFVCTTWSNYSKWLRIYLSESRRKKPKRRPRDKRCLITWRFHFLWFNDHEGNRCGVVWTSDTTRHSWTHIPALGNESGSGHQKWVIHKMNRFPRDTPDWTRYLKCETMCDIVEAAENQEEAIRALELAVRMIGDDVTKMSWVT